ncbi:MAG: hypothetical protein ACKPFK_11685, partial [Dolichospermum sp.]
IMLSIEPGQIADVRPYFSVAGRDIYPDIRATEEWSPFVPDLARRVIEAKNAETKGNLVFICRAARAWRTTMNAPISGMLIDTLAYDDERCGRPKLPQPKDTPNRAQPCAL